MIKLNRLHLQNYRGFSDVKIDFNDRFTCIAGINGAGKTTILSAICKNLALFSNKANFTGKEEYRLKRNDIHKEVGQSLIKGEASVRLVFNIDDKEIESQNCITVKGDKSPTSVFVDSFDLLNKEEYPVFSFYGANRNSKDIEKALNKDSPVNDPFFLYTNLTSSVTDYDDFFSWIRKREDIENEKLIDAQKNKIVDYKYDEQLQAVRKAIESFFGNGYELRVSRVENTLLVKNKDTEISFSDLSDGEKSLLLLFGDIARKLAVATSFQFQNMPIKVEDILNGNGIILIDEIELHLHPSWQRKVCKALKETFPNCQFIITTHSPQVLGELKTDEIWLLNDFNVYRPSSSYGLSSNEVLDEIMDVIDGDNSLSRDGEIAKKISEVSMLVELEKYDEAKKLIEQIEAIAGGELHDTVKYKTVIDMMGED